ncbi:G-protein coupled receptor Mth2 [Holothuria leucospilota]|uniref:G-protein coupled receptor Mth2 n=1 Tax=Holothuria leucospilota TaxID=206669 RepID=A0A9Q1BRD3_HOLLE|nr:G-protein coupled receptor Mth2 [Holothuria leucospilota]
MDVLCFCILPLLSYLSADLSLAVNTTDVPLTKTTTTSPQPLNPEGVCSSHSCVNPWIKDRFCRCDDMCAYYGDCCWDVTNATKEFRQSYPIFQCRSLPGLLLPKGINKASSGYLMVSRCPEGTSKEMKEQCEEEPDVTSYVKAERFLPIKDRDGRIYKNIYCARCNGVNESTISIWKTSHGCRSCPTSLTIVPEHKVQLSSTNCFLSADFQWGNARSCSTGLVDSCPLNFNDEIVIVKCHSYISPGTWNLTWFKNPHCAFCNGVSHYWDYLCAPVPEFEIAAAYGDIYGHVAPQRFPLFPTSVEIAVPVEVEIQEVSRLSECTKYYPLHMYLVVTIPNHQLQNHSCPYFGRRLEKCVTNKMQGLFTFDIGIPWRQIVKFPVEEPFASESTLFFHIPSSYTLKWYWESLMAEIYLFLMDRKDDCDFQDLYLLRVCGNFSFPEEGIATCRSLLEFNSSYILARGSKDSFPEFLNPLTMDPVKNVSWFAFKAKVNGKKIETYKTELCLVEERRSNLTTIRTDIDEFERQFITLDPSFSTRRFPPHELIFSNICIAISITCLLITFVTYSVFPSLRNSFGISLMNFVAAFALGQFLIHFVTDYVTQWQAVCKAAAIATHFMWLATFAWMNLLAWNLKATFDNKKIRALNYKSRKTMLGYFCYGWMVPLCIVIICSTCSFVFGDIIPITYGLIKGVTCWIGNDLVILSVVLGPLAVAIAVNSVLFFLIVTGIRRSRFCPEDPKERSRDDWGKIQELLIYIKISLLMGFVWTVGFFMPLDKSRILWYTIYTIQALQGILIMLLFAFSRRVRSMWSTKLNTITDRSMVSHTTESTL